MLISFYLLLCRSTRPTCPREQTLPQTRTFWNVISHTSSWSSLLLSNFVLRMFSLRQLENILLRSIHMILMDHPLPPPPPPPPPKILKKEEKVKKYKLGGYILLLLLFACYIHVGLNLIELQVFTELLLS